jgi:hypothetical protein
MNHGSIETQNPDTGGGMRASVRGFRARLSSATATIVAVFTLASAVPINAFGQQRPLVTEDPETVSEGQVLVEAGYDYQYHIEFPVSGLTGNLHRVPLIGTSIGVGSRTEIQIDGGLFNRLSITERALDPPSAALDVTGDSTSSIQDLLVGAKIRLVAEGASRPGFGVRFATKLPLASNESGIGLDTTDFYTSLLAAKTVESVRIVVNLGLGILADPTLGDSQNNVLTYGVSFARAVTTATEVVGEVNGRADLSGDDPPPGTESRSMFRIGARYTRGTVRVDGAVLIGMTRPDPTFGVAAGLTYVFNAFQVP